MVGAAPAPASGSAGSSQASYELSASDFLKEFEDNGVVAQAKYKDKEVTVSGVVGTIDFDYRDRPYISVGGGGVFDMAEVDCMLGDVSQTSGLAQGSHITVVGTFSEWDSYFTATLESCSVR